MSENIMINFSNNVECVHIYGKSALVYLKSNESVLFKSETDFIVIMAALNNFTLEKLTQKILEAIQEECNKEQIEIELIKYFKKEGNTKVFELGTFSNKLPNVTGEAEKYYPSRIQIEITSNCNLKCKHCYKRAGEEKYSLLKSDLADLLRLLRNGIHEIGITGGEPLSNNDFSDISRMCREKCCKLELNTNGILLSKVPVDVLKLYDYISISIYGLNDFEYERNVGILKGFSYLQNGCARLKEIGKRFNLSLVLNNDNIYNIEEYIKKAILLGADSFQIGVVSKIGRANKEENHQLLLTIEQQRESYRKIEILKKKYRNDVKILSWDREVYREHSEEKSFFHLYQNSPFSCTAGTMQWCLSEKKQFRPCVLMPSENKLCMDFDEWLRYVNGEYVYNWDEYINRFCVWCQNNNQSFKDYCVRFVGKREENADKIYEQAP